MIRNPTFLAVVFPGSLAFPSSLEHSPSFSLLAIDSSRSLRPRNLRNYQSAQKQKKTKQKTPNQKTNPKTWAKNLSDTVEPNGRGRGLRRAGKGMARINNEEAEVTRTPRACKWAVGRFPSFRWATPAAAAVGTFPLRDPPPGFQTHPSTRGTTGETGLSEWPLLDPIYHRYKVVLLPPYYSGKKKSLAYFFALKDTKKANLQKIAGRKVLSQWHSEQKERNDVLQIVRELSLAEYFK